MAAKIVHNELYYIKLHSIPPVYRLVDTYKKESTIHKFHLLLNIYRQTIPAIITKPAMIDSPLRVNFLAALLTLYYWDVVGYETKLSLIDKICK